MSETKLSKAQWELLDRICRTNGGGVTVAISSISKTTQRLYDLGLIQGKSGEQYCAVHTPPGLKLWRERKTGGGG